MHRNSAAGPISLGCKYPTLRPRPRVTRMYVQIWLLPPQHLRVVLGGPGYPLKFKMQEVVPVLLGLGVASSFRLQLDQVAD